jgi:hypothetical protein
VGHAGFRPLLDEGERSPWIRHPALMWKVRVLGRPNLSEGDSTLVKGGFPVAMAIMVTMRVLMEELLY